MADFQDFIRRTAGQMGVLVWYTSSIEVYTQAQGRRAGDVLFATQEKGASAWATT